MWTIFSPLLQSTRCHLDFITIHATMGFVSFEAANSNKDRARYEQQSLGKSFETATTFTFDAPKARPLDHRT